MSDTVGVYLQKCIGSYLLHCKCRSGGQKTGVLDFLDRLTDGQDKGTIDE